MDLSRDIHPLTDFKRHTPEFLRRLKESGHPLVLTVNGKAEIVVQDAKSYQRLLALAERLETIEAVRQGLESMKRGEGRPAEEVFAEIEKDCVRPPNHVPPPATRPVGQITSETPRSVTGRSTPFCERPPDWPDHHGADACEAGGLAADG